MEKSTIKILFIEDDEEDYILFKGILSNNTQIPFHLDWVKTYETALEAMSDSGYDICFLDYRLGSHTGLEILKQAPSIGFEAPIVFLTGQGDYAVDIQAMEAGAADYLVKGEFDGSVLERVIRYSMVQMKYQQALKTAHDELEKRVEERTYQLAEANLNLKNEIGVRIAAESALRQSENRLNAIMDTVPDVIYRVDKTGIVTFVNDAIRKYGYDPEEVQGQPIINIIHPDDREKITRRINERRTGKRSTRSIELRLLNRNGTARSEDKEPPGQKKDVFFLLSSEGLYETNGPGNELFIGTQGILRDITHLKQEEEKRRQLERQLDQVKKMEAIGTLSGGLAHDFNNLLAAVLGNISLAQISVNPEDEVSEFLGSAEKAVMQARDLTGKFITVSKGGAPIKKEQSLIPVIRNACDSMFSDPNIDFLFSLPEDLWMVEIDERQMKNAIQSILYNAAESMPAGGSVAVKGDNILWPNPAADQFLPIKNGLYVKISIEDHGCGISPESLPHIFDPYFTTKDMGPKKGLGLGLFIVHSIIEKHGGYIFVDSEVNQGTTVEIYIPAPDKRTDPARHIQQPFSIAKGKILVMDDERTVRDVIGGMLESLGYEVQLVENGLDAFNRYQDALTKGEGFEVVLLDLTVIGGMGGKEALKELKQIDPSVKAIVSSGYSDDPIMSNFEQFGFRGAISKPFNMKQLQDTLLKVVGM